MTLTLQCPITYLSSFADAALVFRLLYPITMRLLQ